MTSSESAERSSSVWLWVALGALLVTAMLVCLGVGRLWVPPGRVVNALSSVVSGGSDVDPVDKTVVLTVRLPRVLLGVMSGAVLAMCGGAMQGTLRNPLVGPQTIGVLAGAGFGGSLALFFSAGPLPVMATAFAFGLFSIAAAMWVARSIGGTSVLGIVLAGIVVGALFAALTTLLQYFADPEQELPSLLFWLMGSLANANSERLAWAAAPMAASILILVALAFRINALSSGDDEASSLGIAVERTRLLVMVAVSIGCAAVVAVAGVVAWIGLVAPHMARAVVGADHRRLLPASALVGGVLLLCVDTFCRSATSAEIPLGAATAVIGAPVFVSLLRKGARWA